MIYVMQILRYLLYMYIETSLFFNLKKIYPQSFSQYVGYIKFLIM